ncbi:histidine kinase [uncultured Phocaeicola sp.]|uniref:sensor histidine kinase n=1 Tax=uncultured Phocaeicola sp. TaxID=990718 RepID=UPI0025EA2C74|nr:histidine kinase [uncultured Phocaeicola sp.]
MIQTTDIPRRTLVVLIHIICWGLFFAFPIFFAQRSNGTIDWDAFLHHSIFPLFTFIIFYLNYFIFTPFLLFKEHTRQFLLVSFLTVAVMTLGSRYLNDTLFPPPIFLNRPLPPQYIFYLRDAAGLIFTTGLSVAIRMSIRWSQAESERREAVRSRTEAELKNLRNQLNPHFLLNTLNNIYALIAFYTEKAQQAVQELSKLLRYVLYDNQQLFVPLSKEIDFIRNYIELMRIRVSPQVDIQTTFDIKPESQTPIAPLIFISLIENAFKHGISPTEPSFINIAITETEKEICCTIRNSNYPKTRADKSGSGIGLEQVSKRLELLYPKRYRWQRNLSPDKKEYISALYIQLPHSV